MAAMLAGLAGTSALSLASSTKSKAVTSAASSDAELLKLGEQFDEAYAEWVPLHAEWRKQSELFEAAYKIEPGDQKLEKYFAALEAHPAGAAGDANDAAIDRCNDLSNAVRAIPATTLAGLAAKARVAKFDCFSPNQFSGPHEDWDWDVKCFADLLSEIERLAGSPVHSLQEKLAMTYCPSHERARKRQLSSEDCSAILEPLDAIGDMADRFLSYRDTAAQWPEDEHFQKFCALMAEMGDALNRHVVAASAILGNHITASSQG
jgi:hypothetical protein